LYSAGSVNVKVAFEIPNTFTPNGDGINDKWDIPALIKYPDCLISVYNRFGTMVYQSKGYNQPWAGTCQGIPLAAGVYYYVVETDKNNKLSGSVTIIR